MASLVKVVMRKPYRALTIGNGQVLADGSLYLVQNIREEGKPPHTRSWTIRQVGRGHFAGTMSDAIGPVEVEEFGGNYRFRFTLKGNLVVEQWLTPLPGGRAVKSRLTVHKFGLRVATSEGTIRRS